MSHSNRPTKIKRNFLTFYGCALTAVTPTQPHHNKDFITGLLDRGRATQQRRMRTKFTSEQISTLENTFSRHKYLGATQRKKFAEKLNLSETQVKTWFQNRRMKLKREVQDLRPAFLSVPASPPAAASTRSCSRSTGRASPLPCTPPSCLHTSTDPDHSHPPKSCLESRYFIIALCQRGVVNITDFNMSEALQYIWMYVLLKNVNVFAVLCHK
uniref:Homeobox domain-containing protein n=1 Tax=Lates calcarifer TaxID=8187 RepID=A0A4W6D1N2_LATCA